MEFLAAGQQIERITMDIDVLVSFKKLCSQYPNENVDVLWEMAGGDAELAKLKAKAEGVPSPYFCGECGTRANLPHHPRCSNALDTTEG